MQTLTKILLLLIVPFSFFSCDEINERVLPSSTGKAGDLLIVMDSVYYNHSAGDAVKQTFSQEQDGLPQPEPLFNLIQVPQRSFARIFHPMRNIIMVNVEKEAKIKLTVRKDVWAESQLVVTITAPTGEIAAETITKNAAVLLDYFNNKEIARLHAKFRVNANSKNSQLIDEKFGLSLNLDELYTVAQEAEDFMWLRKDKTAGGHQISQNIMIYTYPYISDSTFDVGQLVEKRNYYTKKYIVGSNEGSYMLSYKEYVPIQKEVSLNGVYVNELRGLWYMHRDFMGGPFINYSLVDEKNNRVICIDGYVYSPKFDKREFLREQEALIKTITF
ncbi:MAG: DUF4837 family protein [Flavobacteriales bacterium]|jgi:hypothetical protein|tara:strand:+ start:9470 stop:10462 length:993 start_codon:yes stop_codon:yes gene_type:complete